MNLVDFARNELAIALPPGEKQDYGDRLAEDVLALITLFAAQGHSGGSAPVVASLFARLATYEPISPITGDPDEWGAVGPSTTGGQLWQNKRCSALFKDGIFAKAHYLDAIVWERPDGSRYSGSALTLNGDEISSRQYVRSFPFTPKTFTVAITETEVESDEWEFTVNDDNDLTEALSYYERYFS